METKLNMVLDQIKTKNPIRCNAWPLNGLWGN